MTTVVILSDPGVAGIESLRALGDRARLVIADDPATLAPALAAAEVVLAWEHRLEPLLARLWPSARPPRWVHSKSAGVDGLLFPDLIASQATTLTNSGGIYSQALAEFTLGAILFFAKRTRHLLDLQARRQWRPFGVTGVAGQVVGIIGLGGVGQAVASAARALGLTVVATRREASRGAAGLPVDRLYPASDLTTMLATCDYVVICAPLTPATRHLIGAAELAAMKRSAILINISRGAVVDEAALIEALQRGTIAGAALDVYASEPLPASSPLYELDSVLLSPHCADNTAEWLPACVDLFRDNLSRYLDGRPLRNVIDKRAGY